MISFIYEDDIILVAALNNNTLLVSYDEGWNWDDVLYSLPFPGQTYSFFDLKYDPYRQRIWASSGAGLCYLDVDQLSVDNKTIKFLPLGFMKIEAFPNPFNPITEITYTIPLSGEVSLTIYDIRGREVEKLIEGQQSPGKHTITWNAENLPSGLYFARLSTANGRVQTRKLVLMK